MLWITHTTKLNYKHKNLKTQVLILLNANQMNGTENNESSNFHQDFTVATLIL